MRTFSGTVIALASLGLLLVPLSVAGLPILWTHSVIGLSVSAWRMLIIAATIGGAGVVAGIWLIVGGRTAG
ncbi:MAG TPA: hypothetical protein VEH07_03975 [Alphaproteobacteria bacterium]|nr:hypothetical protein [Alphaproteobacteria bacterium]